MSKMKIPLVGLALAAAAALALPASAQRAAAPQPLTVQQLKSNVYMAVGGGGNSGIIIGDDGVIVVDAKTTPAAGQQLLAEIAKLTPKKVTHVILTHSDGDHVNGLAAFPDGLTIIAHENNKKEQEAALAAGGRGAPPANRLPNRVVSQDKEALTIDGEQIELYHWAPAHTSGDLVVYLPAEKIVFTGDIIATQLADPIIHLEKHGSSEGWVTTTKGIVGLDADQFVPGHGDLQTKAQIQARLTATEAKRDKILGLVKDGKSLDEIKAALGESTAQGGRGPRFPGLAEVVYKEQTGK
jgi:glyoxylase-like metal-dependent hydrolase (beta-lactamase superfamily II)